MTTGLLLITHDHIGRALVDSATTVMGMCPMALEVLPVTPGCNLEDLGRETLAAIGRLNRGGGVLVLTDLYGATPSNIANRLAELDYVRVVAGLNLPMLIRVLNYSALTLDELLDKAVSGGRDGIVVCGQGGG